MNKFEQYLRYLNLIRLDTNHPSSILMVQFIRKESDSRILKVITYYSDTGPLQCQELFQSCYSAVSAVRREKIDSMVFDKDKRLSLGVELLLMKALDDLGEDADLSKIGYEGNGKPFLKGTDIQFNLSHSEERVMCSVSDAPVGCDVERIQPIELDIARRYFFGSEYESIASVTDDERYDRFYRFWTLKESFMKVTGLGFRLGLDDFCIDLENGVSVDQHVDDREYHFKEYFVNDGYRYAASSTNPDFEDRMRYFDLNDFHLLGITHGRL